VTYVVKSLAGLFLFYTTDHSMIACIRERERDPKTKITVSQSSISDLESDIPSFLPDDQHWNRVRRNYTNM
jgi:hypothetical protein